MRKKLILAILTVFSSILFFQNRANSDLPVISYQLPEPALWKRDEEIGTEIIGPEHYYFEQTEDIDLNIVPIDDDLAESLKTRGQEQFIKDIMNGKNAINGMFGIEPVQLVSSELKTENGAQVLYLNTTQRIENDQFEILEKYFIYKGQAVNFQLRWPQTANAEQIKKAQKIFGQISLQARNTASR